MSTTITVTTTTNTGKRRKSKYQTRPMSDRYRKIDSYSKKHRGGKRKYRGVVKARRAGKFYKKGKEGLFVTPTRVAHRIREYLPKSVALFSELTGTEKTEKISVGRNYANYLAFAIDAAFKDLVRRSCTMAAAYRGNKDGGLKLEAKDIETALKL